MSKGKESSEAGKPEVVVSPTETEQTPEIEFFSTEELERLSSEKTKVEYDKYLRLAEIYMKSKTREALDELKEEIEKLSFDQKLNLLDKSEQESEKPGVLASVTEATKEKVNQEIEEQTNKIKKVIDARLRKIWFFGPWLANNVFKWRQDYQNISESDGFFDKWGKIFWGSLAGVALSRAGYKNFDEIVGGIKNSIWEKVGGAKEKIGGIADKAASFAVGTAQASEVGEKDKKKTEKGKEKKKDKDKDDKDKKDDKEKDKDEEDSKEKLIEKGGGYSYIFGGKALIEMFTEKDKDIPENPDIDLALNQIREKEIDGKKITLKDLKSFEEGKLSEIFSLDKEKEKKDLSYVIRALTGIKTEILLKNAITKQNIENLSQRDENMWMYFSKDKEEGIKIINKIKENPDEFIYNFPIEQVLTLYFKIMPAFAIMKFAQVGSSLKLGIEDIGKNIFGDESLKDKLNSENLLISTDIIKLIGTTFYESGVHKLGGAPLLQNDSGLREIKKDLNDIDKEKLEKLIEFKNYIIGGFLNDSKLGLEESQKKIINENLDYRWIILLYEIMGGGKEINSINLPILVMTLGSIIGEGGNTGRTQEKYKYLSSYVRNFFSETNSLGLNEDEKNVMKIYMIKIIDVLVLMKLKNVYSRLGVGEGAAETDIRNFGLLLLGTGVAGQFVGGRMLSRAIAKKGFSSLGLFIKRASFWLGIISGSAIAGKEIIENFIAKGMTSFDEDLIKSYNNEEFGKIPDILDDVDKSFHVYKYSKNEKVIVIGYKEAPPIVLRNKDGKITQRKVEILKSGGIGEYSPIEIGTIKKDGKDVDLHTSFMRGKDIYFGRERGTNFKGMNIEEFFSQKPSLEEKVNQGWLDKNFGDGNKRQICIPLQKIDDLDFTILDMKMPYGFSPDLVISLTRVEEHK